MIINKLIRFTLYTFIIVSLSSVSAFSQSQMTVETENNQVNAQSDYYLSFETTCGQYFKIFQGQLVITLPSGFSTEALDSVEIYDEFKHLDYVVENIVTEENSIRLYLKLKWVWSISALESGYPSDPSYKINLRVKLSKIQNPPVAGDYQISLVGLSSNEKIVIGPLLSDPFEITAPSVHSIVVTPSEDIELIAGDSLQFSASAYDKHGNKIEGVEFEWSLVTCMESIICIGELIDSTLFVTKTGRETVQATADGVTGYSGEITVKPGELSSISLEVYETQYVGDVIHDGRVILYDSYWNLKTDHDLSASPVKIISNEGELTNYILDDNQFQNGGVIKLEDFNTTYVGMSGLVGLRAENDDIQTDASFYQGVYFNNYDILDLQDNSGETLSSIYVGELTNATLLIQNNGNLKADTVNISYFWQSNPDSVQHLSIEPSQVPSIGVIQIGLTPVLPAGSFDELVIRTESKFIVGFSINDYLPYTITTNDERQFTIEVLENLDVSLNVESIKPDTILHQVPFEISFDVDAGGFTQTIDSTNLLIQLLDNNNNIIDVLYFGSPDYLSFSNGIIQYGNLPAILNMTEVLPNGWYSVEMFYQLYSEGNMYTLSEPVDDSIYVIFDNSIYLVEGSLEPKMVYAGTNVSFEFKVNLESDVPYEFHSSTSQFKIYDGAFSTSTNLFLESDSLYPGENILRSATISIQPEQVGSELLAEADFTFCIPGITDTLRFTTSFTSASIPIEVFELPTVQILDLEVIAPNSPIVNSSQEIQFRATIENHSGNILDSVQLELKTIDGMSTIVNPLKSAYNIQPNDTVTVLFDVVASSTAQSLPESFRVDFTDNSLGEVTPINNFAYLLIEEEALLDINYRVNGHENSENFVLIQGEQLHIQIDVDNRGTAEVLDGSYQFIVTGLSSTSPDTFNGLLNPESSIDFSFIAPLYDTTMQFAFSILETPMDVNYDAPAKLLTDSFDFSVITVSNNAELIIESNFPSTNLVLPGRQKEMFELHLTNNNNSSLNSIQMDFIELGVFTLSHVPVQVRDVINLGNSYFVLDGQKLTSSTSGDSGLTFLFTDFVIFPQETKTIQLIVEFKESSYKDILLEILQPNVRAIYNDGPNIGQEVNVKSANGGDEIVSYSIVFKGSSLEESFTIENNPFNPTLEAVQFAYELSEEAVIEFQLFTLTGEEVYRYVYQPGSLGATVGENIIKWDGRNNSGDMVLNGIYIASILNKKTGEYSRIKVAVVK